MSKIESMVTGNLTKDAELKRSASGKAYLVLVLRVDSQAEKSHFVRASLFGDDIESLAKLKKGDAASLVGKLEVGVWMGSDGPTPSFSMLAHRAISPAARKTRKLAGQPTPTQAAFKAAAKAQAIDGELADDLPWD